MLPAKKTFLPHLTSSIIVLFSVFLAIKNKLVPILEVSQNPIIGGIYDVSKNVFPGLILFSKVLSAKLSLLLEKGVRKLLRLTEDDDPEVVGQDDWSICTLGEREAISNRHVKYRFELDNPAAIVPLEVGQEVTLCTVDSQNKVFKEPFFVVSSPSSQGYFDIIVRRDRDVSSTDKFTKALDTLALGDELAFKVGKNRLNYIGSDDVIEHISIVASGMGIVPAIQILRGILPASDSTVDMVDLLWINEDKSDFFYNRELEKLEYRYFERFSVNRILETDLYGRDLSKVAEVKKQFEKFESGRIGIICGPDYVVNKIRSLFYDMEYPTVNILTIQSAT